MLYSHASRFRFFCLVLCSLLLYLGYAQQTTISISTAEDDATAQLELRNILLPDGSEATLYVVRGSPVTIVIGEDTIIANYVEFDLESGLVRIIGEGSFESEKESVQGRDFTVQLEDNSFDSRDVLISTEQIDVVGVSAQRVAGQFDIVTGQFSPCGRCNQRINDYGFRAERLRLYPGDRLVAFNVTVLIREFPVLFLPLFVLPLGPTDSQPQLQITAGKLEQRAQATLRWPYTVGTQAYGYTELRYYADIIPKEGNFFSEKLLGGRVSVDYLGGGFEHRVIFEEGIGLARFFYTPSFINYQNNKRDGKPTGKTRDAFEMELRYTSFNASGDFNTGTSPANNAANVANLYAPRMRFALTRNDLQRRGIFTYDFSLSRRAKTAIGDIDATFSSQSFIDSDPSDDVTRPSYYSRNTPLRTPFKMQLRPAEASFALGPFTVAENQLEFAVYQDEVNPTNRSVAGLDVVSAARVLAGSTISIAGLEPWAGFRLTGRNSFIGRYYSTQNYRKDEQSGRNIATEFERLIQWNTQITLNQALFGYGNINLDFKRDVTEGETPFRFDALNNISRTLLTSTIELRDPENWISLRLQETYLFSSNRPSERIGPQPLQSSLTLFGNLSWLSLTASNTFELQPARAILNEGPDPGDIDARLTLNLGNSQAAHFNLEVAHLQDLQPTRLERKNPQDANNPLVLFENKTKSTAKITLGYSPYLTLSGKTGYRHFPLPPDPATDSKGNPRPIVQWDDLELTVTTGTTTDGDFIPSLSVQHKRDLNAGKPISLSFEFKADIELLGEIFSARWKQEYTFTEGSEKVTGTYGLTWRDVLTLEASGFSVVPSTWFGLEVKDALEQQKFEIREARTTGNSRWRLTYTRTFDPRCRNCSKEFRDNPGFTNSKLSAFANLDAGAIGPFEYYLDASANLRLADQALSVSYLETLDLRFYLEFYDVVGLQGGIGYQGVYNSTKDEFSTQRLSFKDVGVAVRFSEEFYAAAIMRDVWDFTLEPDAKSGNTPYNIQPIFYFIWDRCCWSLYSSWNSVTGEISIAMGLAGSNKGITQTFPSDLRLPGRAPAAPSNRNAANRTEANHNVANHDVGNRNTGNRNTGNRTERQRNEDNSNASNPNYNNRTATSSNAPSNTANNVPSNENQRNRTAH